jgi:ATP-dependent 26S proteasome regulatory subunit|eukprot:COSAG01_NODE_5850_length_3994_cov_5.826958_2_plen_163_part_00
MSRAAKAVGDEGEAEEDPKAVQDAMRKRAPDPSLAQVRQAVNEYCVLPMGSREVHLHGPYNEGFGKSLMLYGPPGVGKTLLVHAVAAECGMLLFDLSPDTTNNLYPGGGPTKLMVQKVFKVAKHFAPSIIYIDDVHKIFGTDKKKVKIFNAGCATRCVHLSS